MNVTASQESQSELIVRNRMQQVFLSVPDDDMYAGVPEIVLDAVQSKYGLF